MYKNLTISSALGLLAIVLGAFGAHALKSKLSVEALNSFETAVRYQMYHVLVILFVNTTNIFSDQQKNTISTIFIAGIFFFSGSIYLIQLANIPAKNIWFITPLGGLLFCIGWSLIFIKVFKKSLKKNK